MSNHVYWMLELEILAGQDDEFETLMAEMVSATEANEPGTLNYEWSRSTDGKACHIYERYVDSAAVLTHLGIFGERFAERFLKVVKPVRLVIYGQPSAEVKVALAGFGPTYMESAAGFSR